MHFPPDPVMHTHKQIKMCIPGYELLCSFCLFCIYQLVAPRICILVIYNLFCTVSLFIHSYML